MQPEIRLASVEDAEAAAWCHLLCWREAYAGLVEPALLAERTSDIDRRIERWTTHIGSGRTHWISLNPTDSPSVQERVIGFAVPGPSRDEDAPTPLELLSIYVRKAWWGTGLGARLMEVAVGKEPASLWVFEGNQRARAFYRRHGFAEDGARVDDPFFGLPEIRMVRW